MCEYPFMSGKYIFQWSTSMKNQFPFLCPAIVGGHYMQLVTQAILFLKPGHYVSTFCEKLSLLDPPLELYTRLYTRQIDVFLKSSQRQHIVRKFRRHVLSTPCKIYVKKIFHETKHTFTYTYIVFYKNIQCMIF